MLVASAHGAEPYDLTEYFTFETNFKDKQMA